MLHPAESLAGFLVQLRKGRPMRTWTRGLSLQTALSGGYRGGGGGWVQGGLLPAFCRPLPARQPSAPLTWRVPPTWTWRSPGCSSQRARGACGPAARAGSGCTWGSGGDTRETRNQGLSWCFGLPRQDHPHRLQRTVLRHLCPAFSVAFPGHCTRAPNGAFSRGASCPCPS